MLNCILGRTIIAILVAGLFNTGTSFALVNFNDGRDEIFATIMLGTGYDSNISSANNAKSDFITSSTLAMDYIRRAGLIGVDGQVAWTQSKFATNTAENFADPSMMLKFSKKTGRTAGSFVVSGVRESQADDSINQRTESWNYNTGLSWKHMVIQRYSLAGTIDYGVTDYTGQSTGLTDLKTSSFGTDVVYAYTSKLDLLSGYRIRKSDTSTSNKSTDHAYTAGVAGKIYSKLNGSIRAGYQIRQDSSSAQSYGSPTSSASINWPINKRLTLTASITKDVSTTGTGSSVDKQSLNIDSQYSINRKWSLLSGVGTGNSNFLNGIEQSRKDTYGSLNLGLGYVINEHFKLSVVYSYFKNWSSESLSTFDRNTLNLNLSSRW